MNIRPQADQGRAAIEAAITKAADFVEKAGAESVLIIATFTDSDGFTHHRKMGRGNYYSQRGSAIEWIDSTKAPPEQPPPPPDDADAWKDQ